MSIPAELIAKVVKEVLGFSKESYDEEMKRRDIKASGDLEGRFRLAQEILIDEYAKAHLVITYKDNRELREKLLEALNSI